MTTAQNSNQIVENETSVKTFSPPAQTLNTSVQLMESSDTPEGKSAAFIALFYAATNDTLNKAVDYFYQDPVLFSRTVQDLFIAIKAKKYAKNETSLDDESYKTALAHEQTTLKKFIQKMGDGGARIRPFIRAHFKEADEAETWPAYKAALNPYFALKDTFAVVKQTACPCAEAYNAIDTFKASDNHFMPQNIRLMYKKVGKLNINEQSPPPQLSLEAPAPLLQISLETPAP